MNPALAFKAEAVLGFRLVARHRAPRLAVLMAVCLVVLLGTEDGSQVTLEMTRRAILLIGGILTAVGGSRLFAHGGPVAAFRQTASPRLLAPAGRLSGSLLFVTPLLLATAIGLTGARWGILEAFRSAGMATLYGAALAAVVMAGTPLIGASGSAALGLVATVAGAALPSQVRAVLQGWPIARVLLVACWEVLPLPWRAARWFVEGGVSDPAWLIFWLLLGLTMAGWTAARPGASP
jgi:hypothetical protein